MQKPTLSDSVLSLLRRAPDVEAPDLVAVDATDRLLLDEAAPLVQEHPDRLVVIDDSYGALTLGAVALHGARDVRVHQDLLVGERALARNAERTGLAGCYRSLPLDTDLTAGARTVLLKAPKALDALREVAEVVAAGADPGVTLLVGGRIKHMTHAMNDVLRDSFAEVSATLARQKSRVLVARGPRPAPPSFPRCQWQGGLTTAPGASQRGTSEERTGARSQANEQSLVVCAHGSAFAGARIDPGTRALLAHLDVMAPEARTAVDLGCGTGVLAAALARARPQLTVLATDQSAAAVASTRATLAANGLTGRVEVRRDDAAATVPDASVDLVVCNPPFHLGTAVVTAAADRLFAAAGRVLRPGGELWCVYNGSLPHRPALRRLVGPTRTVGRGSRFVVTVSARPL